MITDINSEDRLVQKTFAEHLHDQLGWDSVYAWNEETFGPNGTLGRASEREVVLLRDLRKAIAGLNPTLPEHALDQAIEKLISADLSRSLLQHNRESYGYIRNGVPVEWREDELALFDLLFEERISKSDREKLKQAGKSLLASLRELLKPMPRWMQSVQTQAEVKVFVLDNLWQSLPRPPFTEQDTEMLAGRVYEYVWQRSVGGTPLETSMAG